MNIPMSTMKIEEAHVNFIIIYSNAYFMIFTDIKNFS